MAICKRGFRTIYISFLTILKGTKKGLLPGSLTKSYLSSNDTKKSLVSKIEIIYC